MATNYKAIAKEIIEIVGGAENIISAAHCATRLRLIVKDKELIDDKKIEAIDIVKGCFFTAGQYQIILGTGIVNINDTDAHDFQSTLVFSCTTGPEVTYPRCLLA